MTHERWWHRAVHLVVAVGVGGSLLAWPLYVLLLVLGLLAVVAGSVLSLAEPSTPEGVDVPAEPVVRRLLERGLCWAAVVVAACAYARFSLPAALALLLTVGLTSPAVWRLLSRRSVLPTVGGRSAAPPTDPARTACPPHSDELSAMPVTDLCVLWRVTFWELRDAADRDEVLDIVARRQSLLDELVRRDEESMRRWLGSEARASGGLERFLSGRSRRRGSDAA